jgi:tetratricopeptide (TPR) repeat protein
MDVLLLDGRKRNMKTTRAVLGILAITLALGVGPTVQAQSGESQALADVRANAEKGDAESQDQLGAAFAAGLGEAKDYVEAVRWYRKAAEQNWAMAQCDLADCYYYGHGVAQDYVEAVRWYRKAAEQKNSWAQRQLADCYQNGQGVPKDEAEASMWRLKAAHPKKPLSARAALKTTQTKSREEVAIEKEFNGYCTNTDSFGFKTSAWIPQVIFDKIYPVGRAKYISVREISKNKDSEGRLKTIGIRLELKWEGPLRSGSAWFKVLYDVAEDKYTDWELDEDKTEGFTRKGVSEFLEGFARGFIIGAELHDALSQQ